jgi:uncharacterized NAD(P)/FAD-binding protein YdhS
MTAPFRTPVGTGSIAVVGGGLSGAMAAAALLRHGTAIEVVVHEPQADLGRGLAYSAGEDVHRVNAEPGKLSLAHDDPDDFARWLDEAVARGIWPVGRAGTASLRFAPRRIFGDYARHRLALAEGMGRSRGNVLRHVRTEVTDIAADADGVTVWTVEGPRRHGHAVLATGLFPSPAWRRGVPDSEAGRVLDGPWDAGALDRLPRDAEIVVLGAGLTMIDTVASLAARGHRGRIRVVSRHGLVPEARRPPSDWPDFLDGRDVSSLRQVLRLIREQAALAERTGGDWQAVINVVRQHMERLWIGAPDAERRRFLRHLRSYWETRHHRAPPEAHAVFSRLRRRGQLSVVAAHVLRVETGPGRPVLAEIRRHGEAATDWLACDVLIGAGGLDYDWRRSDRPLPRNLLARGLVAPGPLGLGIAADAHGRVVDALGASSARLSVLGPPLRGERWETTAVPEIVRQAEALALRLAETSARTPELVTEGTTA